MKKFNKKNWSPGFGNTNNRNTNYPNTSNFQRNKPAANNTDVKMKNKGIQCRECDGYGHIQAECANTLKKKKKSFNATWSDEESEGSQEEDDHVSNYVAFNVYANMDVYADSVTKGVADSVTTNAEIESMNIELKEIF